MNVFAKGLEHGDLGHMSGAACSGQLISDQINSGQFRRAQIYMHKLPIVRPWRLLLVDLWRGAEDMGTRRGMRRAKLEAQIPHPGPED